MVSNKANLIVHPVRLRIIQALVNNTLTAHEIGAMIPDVPQATLYRHINALFGGGILIVAEERQVRSVIEKVYELNVEAVKVNPEDIEDATPDDLMRMFQAFISSVLAEFELYVRSPQAKFADDKVTFLQVSVCLNDDEIEQLGQNIGKLIEPLMANQPSEERKRHLISLIMMPKRESDRDQKKE